jgi:hypothetical protein
MSMFRRETWGVIAMAALLSTAALVGAIGSVHMGRAGTAATVSASAMVVVAIWLIRRDVVSSRSTEK